MKRFVVYILVLLLPASSNAQSFWDQFKDTDGWLDVSDWVLNNAAGFMPVPIIITEPAVGEGLGLAALFFHAPKDYDESEFENKQEQADKGGFVVPNISAVAAAKTSNGTWFVGGGHFAHWKDDHVRYDGIAGYASMNLTFYGSEGDGPSLPNGIEFSGEAIFVQQPISFRWKESDFFLGVQYDFSKVETTVELGNIIPGLPDLTVDNTLSGLGAFVSYDSRDTRFTPSTGLDAKISVLRNDDTLGSDSNYTYTSAHARQYFKLKDKWVLGFRADLEYVSGDVPFYMVPFIDMRGIPALRYQGTAMGLVETEARWAFHPRVSLIGFLGAGKAADSFSDFSDSTTRVVQGLGLRYFVARKLGMHAGIDVAKGPEDTFWYLTMGGAWH